MKLRLLNGAHSMIAYLGQLTGLDYVRDVMAIPEHAARVRRHMQAAARTLDPVPGVDLVSYQDQLIERFANPTIAHRTRQIAMDGSQKLPQRIFAAAVDDLAAGRDGAAFADATALWIAYLRSAAEIDDPRAEQLKQAAAQADGRDPTAPIIELAGLFPLELVENRGWRDRVNQSLAEIIGGSFA
jgi:fructuronate reductase